jgi:hypothetical protein
MANLENKMITINGMQFMPKKGVEYKNDYVEFAHRLYNMTEPGRVQAYRKMILNDLWFIVFFVMQIKIANDNKGFVVEKCKEVESDFKDGRKNFKPTEDIWGRYHFKSTIITIAETVQFHLKHPNECSCIFSYKKPAAEKFLDSVRCVYELPFMLAIFPDLLYGDRATSKSQAPSWSLQNGITLRRKSTRKEKTVEASGLVEGMVTGSHYERMIFDDVETADMADNVDQLDKCYEKFDMADNLASGADDDIVRVVGTYYSHCGPLIRIRDMKDADGNLVFKTRIVPSCDKDGNPVLVSKKKLAELKTKAHFNSQHLCDPTPKDYSVLGRAEFKIVEEIPQSANHLFMLVDFAGDTKDKGINSDSWAIGVFAVDANTCGLGLNDVYIRDLVIKPMSLTHAIDEIISMYLRNGYIQRLGIEKIANNDALALHITQGLAKMGKEVTKEHGNMIDLKPRNRKKRDRIISALERPMRNSKWHLLDTIPFDYRVRLRAEMDNFPHGHDDGLDICSYLYDVMEEYGLRYMATTTVEDEYDNIIPFGGNNAWMVA